VYIGMAAAYGWALQSRAALKEIDRAIQLSTELGIDGAWAITAVMRATSLAALGRIAEGQALVGEARARCEQLNDSMAGSTVAWLGGDFFAYLWDPETAIAWFNRELANPRTAQSLIRCTKLRRGLLAAHVLTGDLDQARTLLAENQINECVVTDDLDEVESLALKYPLGALLIFFEGDWQLAEQQFRKTLQDTHRAGVLSCECNVRYRLGWLLRVDNRLSEAEPILEDGIAPCLAGPDQESEIQLRQELISLLCEQNRLAEAKAHLERLHEITAGGEDWRGLGGAVEHAEALVHAAEGNLDLAGVDFGRAVATFRRYAMRWEEAETLRDWGRTLIAAGKSECGATKLNEAAQIYRRCGGGQRWIDRVMAAMPAQPSPASEEVPFENCAHFVQDGDYWTLTFEGKTSRLREAKGLRYIALLLAQPGEEIRALDLVSRVSGVTRESADVPASIDLSRAETVAADLGHAGEVLDAQAKTAYKWRRAELMDEIEEAREFGNEEQAQKAEDEIEALTRELKGAIGLAGRDRRSASATERGRIAVTKAIRFSLNKIAENDASLGKLLSATIKTGTVCAYVPDDRFPVSWRL
jgi:tetratricopeptide (TPR) repeat protein